MTREDLLACLKDRPCDVCKFHTDKGCDKWKCVFESELDGEEIIPEQLVGDIMEEVEKEFDKVTIPSINKLLILTKVRNALYKTLHV